MKETLASIRSKRWFGFLLLGVMVLFFYLVFRVLAPSNFGSPNNLLSYLQQSLMYAVGGCGLYFICVMGLFDFAIGANVVFSSIVGVLLSQFLGSRGETFNPVLGYIGFFVGTLGCATLVGLAIGTLYNVMRVPSMIVTVGLMLVLESVAVYVAGGSKMTLSTELRAFSSPVGCILLSAIAFALMWFILNYTKVGTYCNAIGSNEFTAKNMGIAVRKYKLIGYILLHFFVGIMAVLIISYGTTMTALTGMTTMDRNFKPLMGTFFGIAFRKYGTPITAIIVGEFIISLIFNGFIALGAPTTVQNIVTGAALLLIVALTARAGRGAVVK